jgi:hypothetical protein
MSFREASKRNYYRLNSYAIPALLAKMKKVGLIQIILSILLQSGSQEKEHTQEVFPLIENRQYCSSFESYRELSSWEMLMALGGRISSWIYGSGNQSVKHQ